MKKADLVVVALYTFVVLAGKLAEAAGAGVTVTLITGMSFILAAGGAASWVCRRYPKIAEKIEDAIAASLGHKVLTAGLFGAVAVVDRVSRLHRDTFPPHLAMCGMVGRNIAVPQQAAGRQGGASVANRQKSGTKSSGDDDGDGDPDPDDRIIIDPYAEINKHAKSTPQNRISRKAILAHRGGIYKTHHYAYNWYISRALREIEKAIIDTISDGGRFDISLETREEALEGAWIFFQRLCKTHDFGKTPNLVFFGRGGRVYKNFVRSPDKLHAEIARDCYNPGQAEHRKKSVEIGIVLQNKKEFAADIYSVANGLTIDDGNPCKKISLDTSGDDERRPDRLEFEAVEAIDDAGIDNAGCADEADNDEIDATTEEESLRAGNIARKLVLHVQRAHDQEAAAEAVAEALNMQSGNLPSQVIEHLRKDLANVEVVNAILRAAGFAELEHRKPEPFRLDDKLADFAKHDENALAACPDMYYSDFMDKVGNEITSGNVLKLLKLRVENRSGRFSPEIQKVAAILLKGYEMQKGVRV